MTWTLAVPVSNFSVWGFRLQFLYFYTQTAFRQTFWTLMVPYRAPVVAEQRSQQRPRRVRSAGFRPWPPLVFGQGEVCELRSPIITGGEIY
jgi:hypothetical protein